MNSKFFKIFTSLLALLLMVNISTSMAAEGNNPSIWKSKKPQQKIDTLKYNVYHGKIVDASSKKALMFATITVQGSNLATVSNSDGEFLLKIDKTHPAKNLLITYIGYKNKEVAIASLVSKKNTIRMESAAVPLGEVNIYPHDPEFLMKSLLRKVKENYSTQPNMMTGFYRETIKKNRSYVGIAEAVVNIHKTAYTNLQNDQVQIYKGRKSSDVKRMDTLLFKLQGGPATSLLLDVIKHPFTLLSEDFLANYNYKLSNITKINDQLHYVIDFQQKPGIDFPLYYGTFYIETENLALTSAKFSLNLENKTEATKLFIRKKPVGVKVTATSANYIVNYHQQNGKWYFNYARGEIKFKCNWKRKWFNTNYSAMSEIAITNRSDENITKFKPKDRFKKTHVLNDQVQFFANDDFWGANNTIEPDQSIETAIKKLKRKARK
ncbi:MAG: carboxypeptidase-like regulatory domain-containing protein [Marinifilaceae bacterium]